MAAPQIVADPPLQPKTIGAAIRKALRHASRLRLAVAYVTSDLFKLLKIANNVDVTLVCDLRSPACDPFVIKRLIEECGFKVYAFDRLHAKVYLSDNAVCIASANLSQYGLSTGSLEAGVILTDAASVRSVSDWFDRLVTCSESAAAIVKNKHTFEILVANWKAKQSASVTLPAKPSLLQALEGDSPHLQDYIFTFYTDDDWEYTDAAVRRGAKAKGLKLPPSSAWHRYEDVYSRKLELFLNREMKTDGKKSIAFEVTEKNDIITEIKELESEAAVFVNSFRLGNTLVTNLLRESRPPFRLTGGDGKVLCRKLSAGLKKSPRFARDLSKRSGWLVSSDDLRRLLGD